MLVGLRQRARPQAAPRLHFPGTVFVGLSPRFRNTYINLIKTNEDIQIRRRIQRPIIPSLKLSSSSAVPFSFEDSSRLLSVRPVRFPTSPNFLARPFLLRFAPRKFVLHSPHISSRLADQIILVDTIYDLSLSTQRDLYIGRVTDFS